MPEGLYLPNKNSRLSQYSSNNNNKESVIHHGGKVQLSL